MNQTKTPSLEVRGCRATWTREMGKEGAVSSKSLVIVPRILTFKCNGKPLTGFKQDGARNTFIS